LSSAKDPAHSSPPESTLRFEDLGLSKIMLRAIQKVGYTAPSEIQAKLIPLALEGGDVIGQARTGTGKTASFAIPILEQLDPLRECRNPQALILVPTRELAEQVYQEIVKLAYGCPTHAVVLSGGKLLHRQMQQLSGGMQIVVGTPGRVIDHMKRGTLKLDDIWCVVLDEADRMLDIGFRPDIERILRRCPTDRQTLLLSATLAPEIQKLADRYLVDPARVDCSNKEISVDTIEQRFITVEAVDKFDLLLALLERERPPQSIIFCRTKRGTDKLYRALEKKLSRLPQWSKCKMGCIHGDMNQKQRDRVFADLRAGTLHLLVATDVVGRGIDVSGISHIINYDLPQDCDDYVHRVGRTGRMGRDGIAFSFVSKDQGEILTAIEQRINRLLIRDKLLEEMRAPKEGAASTAAPAADTPEENPMVDPSLAFKVEKTKPRSRLFPMRKPINERLSRMKGPE
jgi:ATP-dependent RNA helicase DeaD